jgi:thiosulfate/3-mercaptopyruvate sulfurtransferase
LDLATDLSAPLAEHGGRHPLPTAEAFLHTVQRIGIKPDSWVIAYDDGDGSGAARFWWLMRYFGHQHTYVLNGGLSSWVADGRTVSQGEESAPTIGTFQPIAHPKWVMPYASLRATLPSLTLIDARSPERYRGESEPIDRRAGHIPGARSWDYRLTQIRPGLFHDSGWLSDYFKPLIELPTPVVVYCGSGVTAAVNLLALALTGNDAILYPGSWSDWISYSDAPIATGSWAD